MKNCSSPLSIIIGLMQFRRWLGWFSSIKTNRYFWTVPASVGLFTLSACLPMNEPSQAASCLPPLDMTNGEQVTYQVSLVDELFTLRLDKIDNETIRLTRESSNAASTEVTLQWQAEDECPNYSTSQTLSLIDQLVLYNNRPLTLVRDLSAQPLPGSETAPTQLTETNLVCTAAPPFEACEADYLLDGQTYHWRAVTQVDGAMPGFGLTDFRLQNLTRSLVTIQLIEWNGL